MGTEGATNQTDASAIRIERVPVARVIELRHRVLRAGLPREAALFEGDEHADSIHLAAIDRDDRVVGCATLHPSRWEDQPAWQLRGMAVAETVRSQGIGGRLVGALLDHVAGESPQRVLWANARVPAARFYQRLGWRVVSEVFEIPTAGPHVKIVWKWEESRPVLGP